MNKEMTKGKNKEKLKEKSIDIEKYETIFDHNITDEELEYVVLKDLSECGFSKEDFIEAIENIKQDTHFLIIHDLYEYRNDNKTAEKYYLMVSEETRQRMKRIKNRDFTIA